MATVERPPDVAAGMTSAFAHTSVSGPGQNVSINFSSSGENDCTSGLACAMSATCTMSGLSDGRPFAA